MSAMPKTANEDKRFTPIQVGGFAAALCLSGVLFSSVVHGGAVNAPRVPAGSSAGPVTSSQFAVHPAVRSGPALSAASILSAVDSQTATAHRAVESASQRALQTLGAPSATSALGTSVAPHWSGVSSAIGSAPLVPMPTKSLSLKTSVSGASTASRNQGVVQGVTSLSPRVVATPTDPTLGASDVAPAATTTTTTTTTSGDAGTVTGGSGGSTPPTGSNATFNTQPAGMTAANFPGILSATRGGYDVQAQADPAFAQQLVTETNAMILQDLTAHSNAFGIGGYQFPANAPFGASNPLFTGQSYGPTWWASSGTPEPPPSDWAIDPITGLPHDPSTGGSVTPGMWAVNPWNPDSPNYDAGLYTAAGQTPPS